MADKEHRKLSLLVDDIPLYVVDREIAPLKEEL